MRTIVSSRFGVDVVDFENDSIHTIRTTCYRSLVYGISWCPEWMFLLKREDIASYVCSIVVLDADLEYVETLYEKALNDVHQCIYKDEKLWITSSGVNQILIYNPKTTTKRFWEPSRPDRKTKIDFHYNSLWFRDDFLYIVSHNRGASEVVIYNYPNLTFVESIQMGNGSHNVVRIGNSLITLDSSRGRIMFRDKGATKIPDNEYPRGLAVSEKHFIVGSSHHDTNRKDRIDRLGSVQMFRYTYEPFMLLEKVKEVFLGHGQVYEVRLLDKHDICHNNIPWTGKFGFGA